MASWNVHFLMNNSLSKNTSMTLSAYIDCIFYLLTFIGHFLSHDAFSWCYYWLIWSADMLFSAFCICGAQFRRFVSWSTVLSRNHIDSLAEIFNCWNNVSVFHSKNIYECEYLFIFIKCCFFFFLSFFSFFLSCLAWRYLRFGDLLMALHFYIHL